MDTTTISKRGINSILSRTFNNKCLLKSLHLIPRPEVDSSSKITTCTAMPIRWVVVPTVVNGATNNSNGRD